MSLHMNEKLIIVVDATGYEQILYVPPIDHGIIEYQIKPHARCLIINTDFNNNGKRVDSSITIACEEYCQVTYIFVTAHAHEHKQSVRLVLGGRKAHAVVRGLCLVSGDQHVQLTTAQEHESPETTSDLLIKGVISDKARLAHEGTIVIAPSAPRSRAYQYNKNLVLGDAATVQVQAKPALEVLNNQVQCAHGSAVGAIDALHIFYLQSRGIDVSCAQGLLVKGFIVDMLKEWPGIDARVIDRIVLEKFIDNQVS
jgi:Fe-S cluster assembly protein SufD